MQYSREILVLMLVHHWQTPTSGCGCGQLELGRSYPHHIADMYEEAMDVAVSTGVITEDNPERTVMFTMEEMMAMSSEEFSKNWKSNKIQDSALKILGRRPMTPEDEAHVKELEERKEA